MGDRLATIDMSRKFQISYHRCTTLWNIGTFDSWWPRVRFLRHSLYLLLQSCLIAIIIIMITRSTGTVHTSAKARLTSIMISVWLSVVVRWHNDVIVAMAMTASACRAVQRRAAQSVDTAFRISQQWRIRKTIPVSKRWSGSPPKFNQLFNTNPLGSFCAKLLRDKQTNNDENITSLAEVIIIIVKCHRRASMHSYKCAKRDFKNSC